MTPAEVAQVLRMNPEVVTRLIREGKLPGFRVGGTWRVRRGDVQAVMKGEWKPPEN
ncbi:MAG: helix-turn-helix domain-containing protein [Actinomycetales bacterium]|nr:helix-turn-helix domain-containing protein [Actinomycetales bacterium]